MEKIYKSRARLLAQAVWQPETVEFFYNELTKSIDVRERVVKQ